MQTVPAILLSLGFAALAYNRLKRSKRNPRSPREWFRELKGWQKLLGLLAILIAFFVILNPEFLALGFLSDATFLDMLALALSVQMISSFQMIGQKLSTGFSRGLR